MTARILVIPNDTASTTRVNINDALAALGSTNSGATEPPDSLNNMLWYDTTNHLLKMKAEVGADWISIGYLDQGTDTFKILDDTVVTTAAGVDTNGIIGDQTTATWQAGTGATESLVSPAKVKAAILALSPPATLNLSSTQDTTSGSTIDFTGVPSTATEINVYFIGYTNTGTSRVQFRVGGSVVTSGYYSTSGSSGAESGANTDGFVIYNDGITRQHNGIMTLVKAASGTWVESHSLTAGGAEVNGGGSATSIGNIDGIRVEATGVFQAGKISIGWR
jgi:hypothetical protein